MPDDNASANRRYAAEIVTAYLRHNQISVDQVASLISTVHEALGRLGKPAETFTERTPAVPIRRSIRRDFVICLECGWKGSVLRRHVGTAHGLSIDQYRARWNLPLDHLMVAPAYSERRSTMAKQLGLGRLGRGSITTTAPETPRPRRRLGRPRTPRS